MPSFCSVVKCGMRAERDQVRFFRFPAVLNHRGDKLQLLSKERRETWVRVLKRGKLSDTLLKNGRVCSRHFISGQPAGLEDKNNPDWVPTLHLGYDSTKRGTISSLERHSRHLKRARQAENVYAVEEAPPFIVVNEDDVVPGVSTQTDVTGNDIANVYKALQYANTEIYSLQSKLEHSDLTEESFKNNHIRTCYFTGLPKSGMLCVIHETIAPNLSTHHNNALSTFQQVLLMMMKLRLNLPFKYLAFLFGVSPFTSSQTFYKCLDVFYEKFRTFVCWPYREILQKNIPECFKQNFGNRVTIIIDCFEVFTETPSKLLTSAQLWSNYKHHQTVTYLIGITPQGSISYISDAWGGRTSDKFITENSGFLDLIQPRDVVLADRGFTIKDALQVLNAELKIPAFTKGKSQLHPLELESTRNIAAVRIHVEGVIGLLRKKYMILRGPIPMSMINTIRDDKSVLDKIATVCSALVNMCPSEIPMD